jgi:hypothetical protein
MRSSQSLGIRLGTNKHPCSTRCSGLRDDPSGHRFVKLPTDPSFDFSSNNAIEPTTPSSAPSFVVRLSMPANVESAIEQGDTSCWSGSNYWKKTRCTSAKACSQALGSLARSASRARIMRVSTACIFSADMSPRLTSAAAMEPGVG